MEERIVVEEYNEIDKEIDNRRIDRNRGRNIDRSDDRDFKLCERWNSEDSGRNVKN